MTDTSRRDFLRRMLMGLGGLVGVPLLGSCTSREVAAPVVAPPLPTVAPPPSIPTAAPAATATSVPATPKPSPELVVARGGDDPELLVRRAVAALGGIDRFVKPGNDVIVKPNICVAYHTYEYAATTNPWVVRALVKMSLEAGARRVRVMDFPNGGTADVAYVKSGIAEQVEAAGGHMEYMSSFKYVFADIPEGRDIRKWEIYEDILKADVVINVPIAKDHRLAKLTMGMKNLMGVLRKETRNQMHNNQGQRLADVASRIRPTLTIVDAVRILVAHGPNGGNLADVRKLDTVIASPDFVAADSYGATLFDMKPSDLGYIEAATAMGLGKSNLASLRIEEIAVA
ncbi:MAG: DUF362 domain-containing protein [Chloroflexi bacterium]|nr:DUF362 domain-containing protein [Chloroflexota bacterium]